MSAFFACILLGALWLLNPVTGHRIRITQADGTVLYDAPAVYDTIEVDFRHSVNKGMIREIYQINREQCQLALKTGYFENYGAGMLDTVPDHVGFREEDGYLVLDFPLQYKDSFTYRAGPEAGHTILYGTDVLPIYQMIPMKSFKISVVAKRLHEPLFESDRERKYQP